MASKISRPKADVARLIEKQMRNWELACAQRPAPDDAAPARQVADFVTISRMVGAGGHAVATALGERLGWLVFDKEILQAMAGNDQVRARLYETLDEHDVGWLEGTLRWLVANGFHKGHYFHRLSETILALARKSNAIFLGRGADLILPRDRGLRVYLIAPPDRCARALAQRLKISAALARAEVDHIQRDRTEFLRKYFGPAADHLTRHDLVLNTDRLTVPEVVELICQALRLRGVTP